MDKAVFDAIENEHDFNLSMDAFVQELEDLGVLVGLPYSFGDLVLYEGEETIEDYEARYEYAEEQVGGVHIF